MAELPKEKQQVTMVTVRDGEAFVGIGRILNIEGDNVVLEPTDAPFDPHEGMRVTLLYAGEDRVMRWRTNFEGNFQTERWALSSSSLPEPGERRDFYRANVEVAYRFVSLVSDDLDEANVGLEDTAAQFEVRDLGTTTADLSGSGVKFSASHNLRKGENSGLLLSISAGSGGILGVVVEPVRIKGDEVALTFHQISSELQDDIVAAVFRQRYGAALGS
jgi:hypothetical protein